MTKKFILDLTIIENYCDTCPWVDGVRCIHTDLRDFRDVGNGFDVMMEIPDWCPLPDYREECQHFINTAIAFGRK